MIDLTGDNGLNGEDKDRIPYPMCSELAIIHDILNTLAACDDEPPLLTLSALLSEVKMWRAKDEYDNKYKMIMKNAITKHLEKNASEMDS
jgi:hypothetical protein